MVPLHFTFSATGREMYTSFMFTFSKVGRCKEILHKLHKGKYDIESLEIPVVSKNTLLKQPNFFKEFSPIFHIPIICGLLLIIIVGLGFCYCKFKQQKKLHDLRQKYNVVNRILKRFEKYAKRNRSNASNDVHLDSVSNDDENETSV